MHTSLISFSLLSFAPVSPMTFIPLACAVVAAYSTFLLLIPIQQQFIKLGKQPYHSWDAFIGILLDGGVAPSLAFLEQESVSVDFGNTDRHRIGASVPHPLHVKVAAVGKIVPGRLSADPTLVEPEVINHRPHRLPLRKSPRRQSPQLPERSVRCATSR